MLGPNLYVITASATDADGPYSANSLSVNVLHVPPTLTLSGISSVNAASPYTLNMAASDPGHTISSWTINWGDGDGQTVSGNPTSLTHTYATAHPSVMITATATDDVATYSANSLTITVNDVPPTLTISGTSSVAEGSTYTLNLSAYNPAQDTITAWTINWGDGSTQSLAGNPTSVTHVYSGPQSATVIASATDQYGTYRSNSLPVTVTDVAPTVIPGGTQTVLVDTLLGDSTSPPLRIQVLPIR